MGRLRDEALFAELRGIFGPYVSAKRIKLALDAVGRHLARTPSDVPAPQEPCPNCHSMAKCDCNEYEILGAIVEQHPIPSSQTPGMTIATPPIVPPNHPEIPDSSMDLPGDPPAMNECRRCKRTELWRCPHGLCTNCTAIDPCRPTAAPPAEPGTGKPGGGE